MANFNIASKKISEQATLTLVDPSTGITMYADDAETLPLQIVVFGKASKQYRNALSVLARKSAARKGKSASFEDNISDNENLLAAVSYKAVNFDMDGEPIDSTEAFKKLYSTPELYWVRDAVSEFLESADSFLVK